MSSKRTLLALILYILFNAQFVDAKSAGEVYADYQDSIYQIRIMEEKSGSRAALGSGFLVANGDYIVTNYHVISGKVMEPSKYRIEIDYKEGTLMLDIHAVDVVSDLALLAVPDGRVLGKPFSIATNEPARGEKIYSMGNPRDIGMTVVEGNYNGLAEKSFVKRIHFSGAINSGMSGGPAVNALAEIVGVNVASGGNQIAFLVPADKVEELLQALNVPKMPSEKLLASMTRQIARTTTAMIDEILEKPWPTETMGEVSIVGKTVPWVDCWGNSKDHEKKGSLEIARGCNIGGKTYIEHSFTTGYLEYEFFYFEALGWPSDRVYHNMARNTSNAYPANEVTKERVGNFNCVDKQVEFDHGMAQRVSYCTRPYLQFKGLYDSFYIAVSTDKEKQVAMSHFTLSGVTKDASMQFLERFMEKMRWR